MHSLSKPTPLSSAISFLVSSSFSSPTMVRVKHLAQHKRRSVRPPVRHVPLDENPSDSSTKPPFSSSRRTVNLSEFLNNLPPYPSVPPFSTRKRSKDSFVTKILGRAKKSRPSTPGAPSGPSEPTSGPSVGPSVSSSKISSPLRSLSPSLFDEDVPIAELFRREHPPSQGKAPARDSSVLRVPLTFHLLSLAVPPLVVIPFQPNCMSGSCMSSTKNLGLSLPPFEIRPPANPK